MDCKRNKMAGRKGFTLIELLVVVAIIVILIAILIPAVGKAKLTARVTATRALLTGLSSDIEAYYENFNAYPGPASAAQTTSSGGAKLSGTQNLLLALSYPIYTSPTYTLNPPNSPTFGASSTKVGIDDGSWVKQQWDTANNSNVDPTAPIGPNDLANFDTNGAFKHLTAYYNPAAGELSPPAPPPAPHGTWVAGGIAGCDTGVATNAFTFPTILDKFYDPLPILYFRRTPNVDGTATTNNHGTVTAQNSPAIVSLNPTVSASYFFNETVEYTNAGAIAGTGLQSPSGRVVDETYGSFSSSSTYNLVDLATDVCLETPVASSATGTATARGEYVLISAGVDRLYGRRAQLNASTQKPDWSLPPVGFDDIVVVGGR